MKTIVKAFLTLKSGAKVQIEGTPEEVNALLTSYDCVDLRVGHEDKLIHSAKGNSVKRTPVPSTAAELGLPSDQRIVDIPSIVAHVKECQEADVIEKHILDKSGQAERVLLPLYIVAQYMDGKHGLTTGQIAQVTKELGVPLSQANASHTLTGAAARFAIADSVRKKGQAVRYKISRRGVQYLKDRLAGKSAQ